MPSNFKFLRIKNDSSSKLILIGSLAAVFIFLMIFNVIFLKSKYRARGIASSSDLPSIDSSEALNSISSLPSMEKSFIRRLSKLQKTNRTQFAEKVSPLDKLRFEILRGKYNIFQVNKKIQRIRLNIGEEGVGLESPSSFLKEYKHLLINDSAMFKKLSDRTFKRDISSSMRIESYEIIEAGSLKGRLDFEFGTNGKLLEVQLHWL